MKTVTKIGGQLACPMQKHKLQVAAYCRVSTDSEEQLVSLATQRKHYEAYITANPDWEFAGIYYDEGITGTKKEKRPALLHLIDDCEHKKIDFIVTKSISRFARNTTDCLELVRKLLELTVYIYFEKENLNTGSMESELMLSILSGLAENESVSIAENSTWSIQRRFQNGTFKLAYAPYGYDVIEGKLVLQPEQATIVKAMFDQTLAGIGTDAIAKELNARAIPAKRGTRWTATTVRGILKNENYTGDAIFQKTYTDSHFNRHHNHGEKDKYRVEHHHEAIITKDMFEATQQVIRQRGKEKGALPQNKKYQNRYPFSGVIRCHQCGATFKRRIQGGRNSYVAWCCATHLVDATKCSLKYIKEAALEYAFVTMMNKLIFGHAFVLKPLLASLHILHSDDSITVIQDLDTKLAENAEHQKTLAYLLAKKYLEPAMYQKGNNELLQEAEQWQHQKDSLVDFLNDDNKTVHETRKLLQYTCKAKMLTGFDGAIFQQFVEQILVYSRTYIGFKLKCGITLRERLV
ncbi:recombinase family protein [Megasphaera cerevisiae]|jgi:DNA invertase Pin-like site-specific DNA recombinase|uniref:recombinase family protein n=1 Tax=Megasphaera cerevisiae TaxID=39029 RepID=UPI0009445AC1|nr:recombinase family protein [Megasphaera cerevisiae]OKY53204.1 recombinase family protein [Megasphaera cerevisiae]